MHFPLFALLLHICNLHLWGMQTLPFTPYMTHQRCTPCLRRPTKNKATKGKVILDHLILSSIPRLWVPLRRRYMHLLQSMTRGKVSRFGFARGRQSSTAASSPLQSITPLNYGSDHQPLFHLSDEAMNTWSGLPDLHVPNSHSSSSVTRQDQVQASFPQHQQRLPSVHGNGELSEAQLRNFILSNQERDSGSTNSRNGLGTRKSSSFINLLPLNFSVSIFTLCRFATNSFSAVSTFRGSCKLCPQAS